MKDKISVFMKNWEESCKESKRLPKVSVLKMGQKRLFIRDHRTQLILCREVYTFISCVFYETESWSRSNISDMYLWMDIYSYFILIQKMLVII